MTKAALTCVLRSPDGRYIASVSFDATTVVWEKQGTSYEVVSSLEGHESEVKSVAWSPSGAYIATCSRDKSVWIWEADPDTDFECISVLHGHTQDVKFVKWHPTDDVLISASYDDSIRIWAENEGAQAFRGCTCRHLCKLLLLTHLPCLVACLILSCCLATDDWFCKETLTGTSL